MDTLGIGIIGSGFMGRTFAECLAQYCRGGRLRAVAGGSRAPALAAEYDVPAFDSLPALLDRHDVDAVIVATPHADHLEPAVAAARAGKHVFLEKPMETSVRRCDAIMQACQEAGVTLCVGQVVRFRGSPRRGKELIDAGRIGRVCQIHQHWRFAANPAEEKPWTWEPRHGGIFLDAGAHTFDLLRWYAGAEAVRVYGTVTRFSDVPWVKPTAMAQVTFANGVIGSLWLTHELPQPGFADAAFRTQVVGSTGLLDVDAYGKVAAAIDGRWETIWEQPPIDYTVSYLNPIRLEAFAGELQDFLDSIREGRAPFATGQDGRAAIEMIEAADRSSETGEAVRLPLA